MVKSKISRSFVVAVFIVMIVFLGYLDVKCIINEPAQGMTSKIMRLGFVFGILMLVIIYIWIKDKLYRIKMKRSHALILRHIYIAIAVIITNLLTVYKYINNMGILILLCNIVVTLITAFIIKKIIFNVSKSDMLAVVATFTYSMLPMTFENVYTHIISVLITLFYLAVILVLQMLIDELKQKGIKTSKYLILALMLGIFMGITCILGVNFLVWSIAVVLLLLITVNLDNTHMNFPKKIMNSITQENRERLYKIERINISKLLICIFIALIVMFVMYFIGTFTFNKIVSMSDNVLIHTIGNNISDNNKVVENISQFSIRKLLNDSKVFLKFSKNYYMTLFVYILLVETLSILLKRKYDTKSTILKLIFVLTFFAMSVFSINIYIMQPLFSIILMLIAIVNTSSIYLNREERVKMLVA